MSEAETRIRPEEESDREAVYRVNQQAFGRRNEAELVDRLREGNKISLSLVATRGPEVVGHILFSPVSIRSDEGDHPAVGLAPMAVLPAYQNQGIGSMLVKEGLEGCRRQGHRAAVVLGHPEYYPRFGFHPARSFGIGCEFEVPDEVFMALPLEEGGLDRCSGVVHYQDEFKEA